MSTRQHPRPLSAFLVRAAPLASLASFALLSLLTLGLGWTAACAGPGDEGAPEETAATEGEGGTDSEAAGPVVLTTVPPDLMQAFVGLDRDYIPALVSTQRGERQVAVAAMDRLQETWDRFSEEWAEHDGSDLWGSTMEQVENHILQADALVDIEDGDLMDAHTALEEVRILLWDLRVDMNVEYYLDRLTAFHEVMEEIERAARADDPAAMDLERIRELEIQATAQWQDVVDNPPDPHLFALSPEGLEAKIGMAAAVTEALERLTAALEGEDRAAIQRAARGIKPPFAELYMSFGDWKGLEPGE